MGLNVIPSSFLILLLSEHHFFPILRDTTFLVKPLFSIGPNNQTKNLGITCLGKGELFPS